MDTSDIEGLLRAVKAGERGATDALYRLVYSELHKLAAAQRRRWGGNQTMGTTALVHEAYLKLGDGKGQDWEGRRHFFGTAAMAMRHVLVSYARAARADKRGGGVPAVEMDLELVADPVVMSDVLALHDALERLEALEPRWARVVECRVFAGMSITETADALDVSAATVKRDWTFASAWLYRELQATSCPSDLPPG
jgi:RNA polymerase sigma factor (TIGR02999 family)